MISEDKELHVPKRLLPKFSIARPVTVIMILIAILVIGAIAYQRIKTDLFPEGMQNPYLNVYVPYRDANPREIEEQIAIPMERELKTVKNLKELSSNSSAQGCYIWMEFNSGTNMDLVYAQVYDRLERARPYIPSEIEHFYIRRHSESDIPVIYAGISYPPEMEDPFYAVDKLIKQPLEGIAGVAGVELFGLKEKYIQINLDLDKIRTYKVSLTDLFEKVMNDNFALSSGHVYRGDNKFLLRSSSRFHSLEDIKNIPIRKGLKLGDIAQIIYDFSEENTAIMRVDGRISGGLEIKKESTANTVEVCRRIEETLKTQFEKHKELSELNYFVFFNQGKIIDDSIDNVNVTAFWGGLFAFLVLFAFLRQWKITIMLTLAIPLSVLITVISLYFMGWTLNIITMLGIMLSIGLVVDNAVVITENIYRFIGMGYPLKQAAVLGASEVGLAITLATFTTVIVFIPLMIMGGSSEMSFFLIRIGTPVIFALIASLLIALIFIPLASLKAMPNHPVKIIEPTHNRWNQWYQTILVKMLKKRPDALIIIILIIASMIIPIKMGKETDIQGGGMADAMVRVSFPPSYSLEKRDKTLNYVADRINQNKEAYHIDHIMTRAHNYRGHIQIYLKPNQDRQWYQVLYRKLANLTKLSHYHYLSKEEFLNDLKKQLPEIPDVKMRTSWQDQSDTDSSIFSINLRGYDTTILAKIAEDLENQLQLVEGVVSIENDIETGNDEIHITVDREKAFKKSIDSGTLARIIAFNLRERKISNFQTAEKEIPIYLKTDRKHRQSLEQLKNIFIPGSEDAQTSLNSLTSMGVFRSQGNISRENSKSFLEMRIYLGENSEKTKTNITAILDGYQYPTGYYYEQGKRTRRFNDQNTDLVKGLLFSAIFVFLLMGVLFESFILPLSILVSIPAAFVGSYWLLLITGTAFEIMAGIGLIILIGVVVNNAIVLIDLINQYRKTGMNREHAILVAGMHRFRPILMTAGTTICGLLPMAIGNASLIGIPYAPLGITMIGGLFSSTLLTLFAVPLFYTYFDDLRTFFPKFLARFR